MLAPCVLLVVSTALAGFAVAQNHTQFTINPDLMEDPSDLVQWCNSQRTNCPIICGGGGASPNTCDPNSLTYSCVCLDGSHPNISNYANTIESLVCQEYVRQCVLQTTDPDKQAACESIKCGEKDPSSAIHSTTSKTTMGGGSTMTKSGGASDTAAQGAPTSSGAAIAVMQAANSYGTPALAGVVLAIFGYAL